MENKRTTTGVGPEQLADLLRKGMDVQGEDSDSMDQRKADFLRLRLGGALPLSTGEAEAISVFLAHVCRNLLPLGGRALGDLLLDEQAPLDAIEAVKGYGKQLSGGKDREVQHEVAIAIYYAAIANAVLFHDKKITSFGYSNLADAFSSLQDKSWMDPRLARLFAKAAKACRKKIR